MSTHIAGNISSRVVSIERVNNDNNRIEDIGRLRCQCYGVSPANAIDEYDEFSENYLATIDERPCGALRVTRASAGPLEIEQHVPSDVLNRSRNLLCSASRMVVMPGTGVADLGIRLVEAAWKDQLCRGIRADIVAVGRPNLPYFGRMGYRMVDAAPFIHNFRGTLCQLMIFFAAPSENRRLSHLFTDSTAEDARELRAALKYVDWRKCCK